MNLADVLDPRDDDATTVAVYTTTDEITRAELRARAEALTALLRAQGLRPGQAVGVMLPNGPDIVAALFGIWFAGGVYVPLNPRLSADELAHVIAEDRPAAIVTLPALIKVDVGGTPVPLAFYAVTSIAVIGLYLAFAIPIYLRWRMGDAFEEGAWTNGSKYKWMNPIAVAEIIIVSLFLMMPTTPAANPFRDEFELKFLNYAPVVTLGALLLLTIWWNVSAKKWFTGPKHNIDPAVVEVYEEQ